MSAFRRTFVFWGVVVGLLGCFALMRGARWGETSGGVLRAARCAQCGHLCVCALSSKGLRATLAAGSSHRASARNVCLWARARTHTRPFATSTPRQRAVFL